MPVKRISHIMLIAIAAIVAVWFLHDYGKRNNTFYGDAMGYYLYLPATFIYHNHTSITDIPEEGVSDMVAWYLRGMGRNAVRTPKGYVLNQYTYGVALMELPFFAAAHAYETWWGTNPNGYAQIYDDAIKLSSMVYALIGLWLLYLVLKRFFTGAISLLAIFCIFMGTNMFWFTLHQAGMAHVPLFFLYTCMLGLTIRLHEKPHWSIFALTGFVAGLITVIRPTDILCLLIPLLYNVYSRDTYRAKLLFLKTHAPKILLMAAVFTIPIIPQLLYWKHLTGSYVYYSYGSQTFNWDKPRIIEGMFYFANGWLAYSPIMFMGLAGLFFYKKIKPWAWCLWLIVPLYIYIVYSWYNYTYINGLGSRPMIHIYPLLAIPFAAVLSYIAHRKLIIKVAASLIGLFLIALNLSFNVQAAKGILISEESNAAFAWQTLFKTKLRYRDLVAYDVSEIQPEPEKMTYTGTLLCYNFNDSSSAHYLPDTVTGEGYIYHGTDEEYAGHVFIPYNKRTFKDARWLKYSGRFLIPRFPAGYEKHMLVGGIRRGDEFLSWRGCKVISKIGISDSSCEHIEPKLTHAETNKWGTVYFFTRLPKDMQEGDEILLEVWNMGREPFYLDDLCVELYK